MNFKIRKKQTFSTSYHIEEGGITFLVSGFRPQTLKKKGLEMCGCIPVRNESCCYCKKEVT